MKKSKRKSFKKVLMLSLLGALCFAAAVFSAACKEKIEFITTEIRYMVGDNIDAFSFVERKNGCEYKFSLQKEGETDITQIEGRTFVVSASGNYTLFCEETEGKDTRNGSTLITVYDTPPLSIVPNENLTLELYSEYPVNSLIAMNGNIFILSDSSTIRMIDYGTYFENDMDVVGDVVEFYDSSKPMEEFNLDEYKNVKIKFDKEGLWLFHVVVQNKGGSSDGMFRVYVSEDLEPLEDITASTAVSFDEKTQIAEWSKVEGASGYRVKIGSYVVSTEKLTADMSGAYYPEFSFVDLVVVPFGEDGYNLGKKIVLKNQVVSEEGFEGVVINDKATIEKKTRTVSLVGDDVKSGDWWNSLLGNENGYIGFKGDYGVGTYIETVFGASSEFIGNVPEDFGSCNMPQIVLFADSFNGNKTSEGGNGILLSSGLGAWAENSYQTALHASMDLFSVHGPDRVKRESVSKLYALATTAEYPLLTQNGMKEYGGGKTYKYIVGTKYSEWGHLLIDVTLLQQLGNDFVEITTDEGKSYTNILIDTGLIKEDVEKLGTNILLLAENKYRTYRPTTTFTFKMPEYKDAGNTSAPKTQSQGATFGSDGSLKIVNKSTGGLTAKVAGQWAFYHNYFAILGEYGVGTYMDFKFTGINMPQLILFAEGDDDPAVSAYQSITNFGTGLNKENSVNQGRKGVVILNGLMDKGDYLQVFGPTRMDYSNEYGQTGKSELLTLDKDTYPELTRTGQKANLDKKYALTVGTFVGDDGKVWIDIELKNAASGETIHSVKSSLGILPTQVGAGDIIILPPFGNDGDLISDGKTQCVIDYISAPYVK